jgi:superfamily II DNA or RNA helicase
MNDNKSNTTKNKITKTNNMKNMKNKSPKNEKIVDEIERLKKTNILNTYLGNKGYSIFKICLNENLIKFIKEELTVRPFVQNTIVKPNDFPVYQESDKKIYVPRFWGIKYFGEPKEIKISYGKSINLTFKGELRDYQTNVLNNYLEKINYNEDDKQNKGDGSALIELWTGAGKTVLALKILQVLKKKTILFVHKSFLKDQWIERIEQYLPDAKIGIIQGPIIDIENKDIVIAMIQSISMKSYPDSLFDDFGLSIYDECHHISSEIFSNCLRKCTTLYSLGLSATMNRKDGLTHVFKMYLGDICNKDSKQEQPKDDVLVKAIDFEVIDDDEYNEIEYDFRGTVKYTTMVSKISNYSFRSDFIVNVIENELNINKNQQFIVLAQTKNLLNYLFKAIKFKEITSVGYYVGGMKQNELKESESKQIILATYSMAAEGLDIKSLTTLVLASPKSDIVQSVGRILREKHSKPLIIDIIDKHLPFINQFQKRKSFYNQKEYKIIRTNKERYLNYIKMVNNAIKNNETFEDDLDKSIWNEIIPKTKKTNISNINNKKSGNLINIDVNTEVNTDEDTDLLIEKKFKCLL